MPDEEGLPFGGAGSGLHDVTALVVGAAVVERAGRLLVARRQPGTHLAGYWEFPGGKCQPGESLAVCIMREMREELNVGVTVGEELFTTRHEYPERTVELHFLRCELIGEPEPQLGQEIRWVLRRELDTLAFLPGDAQLIRRLMTAG